MALIADEVFLDYRLTRFNPLTFSGNDDALTFTLSGLSKISALPQMKVAWIAVSGPSALKSEALARLEVIADTYLSMNAPIQLAVPRCWTNDTTYSRSSCSASTTTCRRSTPSLAQHTARASDWRSRAGGMPCCACPYSARTKIWQSHLLESTGVLLQPGHFYNFPSDGYLVASLITPTQEFDAGISRALEVHLPPVRAVRSQSGSARLLRSATRHQSGAFLPRSLQL